MKPLYLFWNLSDRGFRTLVARIDPSVNRNPLIPGDVDDAPESGARLASRWWIAVEAPAESVWPWLSQMMRGGGMYGLPSLEDRHTRSADYLLDDLPPVAPGDRVGDLLEVTRVETGREIVWRANDDLEVLGGALRGVTIEYRLEPTSPDSCRLHARLSATPTATTPTVGEHLFELLNHILPCSQLRSLKTLAERETHKRRRQPGWNGMPHQAAAFVPAKGRPTGDSDGTAST